jgi:hypothetical protein
MPRKLDQGDADMIRVLYASTAATMKSLAAEYQVSTDAIRNVVARRSFRGPQRGRKDRKYTSAQVREVHRLRRDCQYGPRKIASVMGLPESDRGIIDQILKGLTYKDVIL